jgi:hypothetical protein
MAAEFIGPMGMLERRRPGTAVRGVRDVVEHVRDARAMPWLLTPVDVDVVPAMRRMVAARGLVRGVKTVADPAILRSLKERLGAIQPNTPRRWGTLTPHEMLCHLGDAGAMVLMIRPRTEPVRQRHRPIVKWIALWSPLPFPRGWPTNPLHNPRDKGTRPSQFEKDLARAIEGIEGIAAAAPNTLEPAHGTFGTMSVADWQRWAYKHADHHLRQFGL